MLTVYTLLDLVYSSYIAKRKYAQKADTGMI